MTNLRTVAAVIALSVPSASFATTITTIRFGDEDCFGSTTAPCGDGTVITAPAAGFDADGKILPFPTLDQSTASDPAGTDVFGELGPLDFSFFFTTSGLDIASASLTVKVWGLDLAATSPANGGTFGDAFEGARFQFNGADVGTSFAPPGDGPNLVQVLTFDIAPGLIVDGGQNVVTILPEQDFIQFASAFFTGEDAFAVDYVDFIATLENPVTPPSAVPLPAGFPLLLGGLATLGFLRRRSRR